jgi:hypothetical protein
VLEWTKGFQAKEMWDEVLEVVRGGIPTYT